jgi:hypothetical protein
MLLSEKLAANSQRLLRMPYLDALPAMIRAELEPAHFLCVPDDAVVRQHSYISTRGAGAESSGVPAGFIFREFSWPDQVYAAVAGNTDQHDSEPALFRPFQV